MKMNMKRWSQLIIDVDYSPSDPGINNCFCERTKYDKATLTAGKKLPYKDPGGLFGGITVKEADDSKVVLSYGDKDCTLFCEGQSWRRLATGGRDYTNFELSVYLVLDFVIENTPAFFRQFQTRDQLLKLSERDIQLFEASEDPCAKFVLGRWHRALMPREESARLAEKYFREAADAGIADAYDALSILYANADTAEDRVELEESARLRDEAIRRGSESARMRYARNRVAGVLLAPEEPAKVAGEIEQILQEGDVNPGWYSILAYAYETLGKVKEAGRMYEEGVKHGCLRCYGELAIWYLQQGNQKEYEKTMEAGMNAGSGFCFSYLADLPEEEYQKKTPELKRHFTRYVKDHLERGMRLASSACAFFLAYNHFYGFLGFDKDSREVDRCLERGMAWGDFYCYSFLADILEMGTPSDEDRKDAARLRLKALRLGDDSAQGKVILAYRRGLLREYQDEIEKYWLPEGYDDYEEDDGRWDAYA